MSDGSTSSGSNIGTGVKNPMIADLNANNYSLTNVGTINNFDIGTFDSDLTIVKDKTLHVRYPTTLDGTTFYNNVYADKFIISGGLTPPGYLLSDGSIVSNSVDNTRLTALETKTQNVSSTSSKLSLSKSFELKLDTSDFFAIRSIDSMLNYLIFTPTSTMLYTDLNMNAKKINNVSSITISGFETSNFFLKSDGTLDINNYLTASSTEITNKLNINGSNAMTGALNMNSQNIVSAGSVSATSLTLGGASTSILRGNGSTISGTASQYVMGNGTLLTATYPTMTTGSFTVQWTGGAGGTTADRTIEWRRLSDGISTTVWLKLPVFSVTIGTASNFGVGMTTATVPANLSVASQPHLPIIVAFNGVVQCGWLHHFGTSLGVQPSNKAATVVGQVCGIPNVAIVSYMI